MKITAILSSLFLSPTLLNSSSILTVNNQTKIETKEFNLDNLTIKGRRENRKIQALLHNDVFYTSINEFLKSVDSVINYSDLNISFQDNKTTVKLNSDPNFYIEFDANKKKITVSNNKIFTKILKDYKRGEEDLKIKFLKEKNLNNTNQFEIDLSKYDIDILKDQNNLYLPAILLNQVFLSESNIQTYFNGDDFKIFKFYEALSFPGTFYLKQSDKNNEKTIPLGLRKFQYEYLSFLFDNYYAIKLNNNISYKEHFKKYQSKILSESSNEHYLVIKQIINELDDPHSAYVLDGYYDKDRDFHKKIFDSQKRVKNKNEVLELLAKNDPNKIDYELKSISNDTSVISFSKFDEKSAEYIQKALREAQSKNVKNIIFNLTQNGGGYIGTAYEIMGFLTDKPFKVYSYNPLSKEKKVETIKSEYEKFNFNYYILTSPYSFSAGNIFPQIAKDNKLAKLIGYKTFGGASAINYYVLPTGDIIQLSSNNVFTNKNFESLEFGVRPDVELKENVFKNPSTIYETNTLLDLIKKADNIKEVKKETKTEKLTKILDISKKLKEYKTKLKIEKFKVVQPSKPKQPNKILDQNDSTTQPKSRKITNTLVDLTPISKPEKPISTRPWAIIQPANKINMLSTTKPINKTENEEVENKLLEKKTNIELLNIKNLNLGKLDKIDEDQILIALKNKNPDTLIDTKDLKVENITNNSAQILLKDSDQKITVHFLISQSNKTNKNTIWIVLLVIGLTTLLGLINFIIIRKLKTKKLNK
ncbi:S41 family peptidase [Mycoplasma mycoides]|uniref:S41 family peptidase n=1 Tax=Mycoplasma mycoides TaxID=2102 RepID=UPI0001793D9D|nr:S41 family peptidase [Mycoplasma mycoides]ADH21665.1 peptidase, S41 family [synthetic Mycoplasma mycoides JCVI-syn1.0]ACU78622.1 peptidase, S41 family [Mycoplasma mycoides subsp. capri str. GM12]ACU79453.1 peptidase, S41 family [Mycoplasma mycoides subsp. capri str. GM12]SRX60900.1 peptidase S41 [Mycoplasma mycoides subsp. capri]SRX62594.1 peptidase S41 [Mycoplasma mycoides subsp. capri]